LVGIAVARLGCDFGFCTLQGGLGLQLLSLGFERVIGRSLPCLGNFPGSAILARVWHVLAISPVRVSWCFTSVTNFSSKAIRCLFEPQNSSSFSSARWLRKDQEGAPGT
jgi:hypothetical protein